MDAVYNFDFAILDALQKIHCTVLNAVLAAFSYIGEGAAVWLAAALILALIPRENRDPECPHRGRKAAIATVISLLVHLALNEHLIKNLVKRPRPFTLHPYVDTIIHKPSSFSFPSGHSCSSFAAATAIFCFNKKAGIAAYVVAALIAFSRIYFYIHFPTDILCGALEGVLIGVLTSAAVKKWICPLFDKKRPRAGE